MTYKVIRDITKEECPWLDNTIAAGTTLYKCTQPTFGCIGGGIAVTYDSRGNYPFFEVPQEALTLIF